jgi:large subunit ribosomal protein L10
MPTPKKVALVEEIRARFADANAVILVDYRGLTVKEMQTLRGSLRQTGSELKIYKNSLTEIAVSELEVGGLIDLLAGPTAFMFASADPVAPAKAIMDFAKEHQALEVKGGLIEGNLVDAASIKAVAALPSRDELIAKLLGTMLNPMSGFVRVLNGPAAAFARVLKAVADQKAAA